MPTAGQAWAIGFSIDVSSVLIVALAWSHQHLETGIFHSGIYAMAVAFEVVAIRGAIWLLRRLAVPQLLTQLIGFIVGLHVLGLWRATNLRVFLWTALAMCLVCGLAACLPDATPNE